MKDVARAAGVSQATVSNAFNNRSQRLSDSQRLRVLQVATDLGYLGPNPAGRSLRTGVVGAIGVMITDSLSYAFDDLSSVYLLKGVAEVGELADVALTLLPFPPVREGQDALSRRARDALVAQRSLVDGFLVYSMPDDHPAVEAVLAREMPTVIVDSPIRTDVHFVGIRDRRAARESAEHLLALGHTRFAVLVDRLRPDGGHGIVDRARLRNAQDAVPRERVTGYAEALRRAGLDWSEVPVIEAGGFGEEYFRTAVEKLASFDGVTAILATTDGLALTALSMLNRQGVDVPGEVSIVGFDDVPAASNAGLTTVHQPLVDKGREAARLLVERPQAKPRKILLPTRFVARTSTARPPGRRRR